MNRKSETEYITRSYSSFGYQIKTNTML